MTAARGIATAVACALVAAVTGASDATAATKTPIRHVVTLMQENHTYDNYFGTYPRGDGIPPATCMPVDPQQPNGPCVKPFRIGSNAIEPTDLDHSAETAARQLNGGKMNGFVHALNLRNQDGRLAMGYYDDGELPYYWNLADRFVLFDRFFSSSRGGSFLNHLYWTAASAGPGIDRVPDPGERFDVMTIFDRLEAAGISWKFYVQNYEPALNYRTRDSFGGNRASQVIWVPLLNVDRFIDDPRLRSRIVDLSEYYRDLERGTLPAVSYIVPSGPSEHPPSRPSSGQAFVRSLVNALMRSSAWTSSALVVAYDDWGGWYDHVRPPDVDAHGLGFRVPAYLVSAYARRGHVDSTRLEFSSIPQFIAENWGLEPVGDRRPATFHDAFDFSGPPRLPALIPSERGVDSVPGVNRVPVLALYLGALAVGACILTAAAVATRFRREHGSIDAEVAT